MKSQVLRRLKADTSLSRGEHDLCGQENMKVSVII